MSIRKVSDLPGLNTDSVEFDIERFKQSLLELSYVDPAEDVDSHTYKSMYMKGQAITDAVLSAGHLTEILSNLSAELSAELSIALSAELSEKVILRKWN